MPEGLLFWAELLTTVLDHWIVGTAFLDWRTKAWTSEKDLSYGDGHLEHLYPLSQLRTFTSCACYQPLRLHNQPFLDRLAPWPSLWDLTGLAWVLRILLLPFLVSLLNDFQRHINNLSWWNPQNCLHTSQNLLDQWGSAHRPGFSIPCLLAFTLCPTATPGVAYSQLLRERLHYLNLEQLCTNVRKIDR